MVISCSRAFSEHLKASPSMHTARVTCEPISKQEASVFALGVDGVPNHIALFTFSSCNSSLSKTVRFALTHIVFTSVFILLVHIQWQYVNEKNADKLTDTVKTVGKMEL